MCAVMFVGEGGGERLDGRQLWAKGPSLTLWVLSRSLSSISLRVGRQLVYVLWGNSHYYFWDNMSYKCPQDLEKRRGIGSHTRLLYSWKLLMEQ